MSMIRPVTCLLLFGLACCTNPTTDSETRPAGENILPRTTLAEALSGEVHFNKHVKPVLGAKCAVCHNQKAMPGRMSLESREQAVRSGALGIHILPGRPEKSLLLTKASSAHAHLNVMPPVGERLTGEEVKLLRRWIAQGATWPAGKSGITIQD